VHIGVFQLMLGRCFDRVRGMSKLPERTVKLTKAFETVMHGVRGTLSIEAVVPSGLSQPELRRDAEGAITVVSKFAKA
jgi:hypothetical protein